MTGVGKPLKATPEVPAAAAPRAWLADFVLLGAIWGSSFLFTRIATLEFGPVPTAAVRVVVAAASLLPLLWLRGLAPEFRRHWKVACTLSRASSPPCATPSRPARRSAT